MDKDIKINCYCGQSTPYKECCQPYHLGELATTPEALMRSRFSAFATANASYILDTQIASLSQNIDPKSFAKELQTQKWIKLEVLEAKDDRVAFIASMLYNEILYTLTETSSFIKENEKWLYAKAIEHQDREQKMKRNENCPCGSKKKYKQCCQKV